MFVPQVTLAPALLSSALAACRRRAWDTADAEGQPLATALRSGTPRQSTTTRSPPSLRPMRYHLWGEICFPQRNPRRCWTWDLASSAVSRKVPNSPSKQTGILKILFRNWMSSQENPPKNLQTTLPCSSSTVTTTTRTLLVTKFKSPQLL